MKLLHIIASPRGEKSRTLSVSSAFINSMKAKNPDILVDELDLFEVNLPEVSGGAIDAKYTLMSGGSLDEKSKNSWEQTMEFSSNFITYDAYLISSPMWNFSIPYKLKHYIDVIMQAGILFSFTEKGVEGLAKNKKMFCVTSRGNDYSSGSQMQQYDFQEPYLRAIFGFTGIYDITFIHAQPMDFTPGITEASLNKAKDEAGILALSSVI
jgi:FMN-dependent NADH-azoreductase